MLCISNKDGQINDLWQEEDNIVINQNQTCLRVLPKGCENDFALSTEPARRRYTNGLRAQLLDFVVHVIHVCVCGMD